MNLEEVAPIAALLAGITAGIITVIEARAVKLILLAVQYVCVTFVVSLSIPAGISVVKLVAGWTACLIFTRVILQKGKASAFQGARSLPSGWIFRMIAVLLFFTAALGLGRSPLVIIQDISPIIIVGALLLGGLGLLQVGLYQQPLEIGIGLLTLISGFELIYSSLEPSVTVVALLAAIHIGIAFVISVIEIEHESIDEQREPNP